MKKVEDLSLQAPAAIYFSTNYLELRYNSSILFTYDISEQIAIIIHEVLHIVNNHYSRLQNRFSDKWNIACDLAVNSLIKSRLSERLLAELLLPEIFELPPLKSADWYYTALQNKSLDIIISHPQWDSVTEDHKRNTDRLLNLAQLGADPPAEMDLVKPSLNWDTLLRKHLQMMLSPIKEYSHKRWSRRFERPPGKKRVRQIAPLLIALDISGSIQLEYFDKFIQEIHSIVSVSKSPIWIAECDTEIRANYPFQNPLKVQNSNGGTKFKPVLNLASAMHRKGNLGCLIYFTDGRAEDLLEIKRPSYPVIWVYPEKLHSACVPWGVHLWM